MCGHGNADKVGDRVVFLLSKVRSCIETLVKMRFYRCGNKVVEQARGVPIGGPASAAEAAARRLADARAREAAAAREVADAAAAAAVGRRANSSTYCLSISLFL